MNIGYSSIYHRSVLESVKRIGAAYKRAPVKSAKKRGTAERRREGGGRAEGAALHRSPLQKHANTFFLRQTTSPQRSVPSGGILCRHDRSVARSWSSPYGSPSMTLRHQLLAQGMASTPSTRLVLLKAKESLQSPSCPRDRQAKQRRPSLWENKIKTIIDVKNKVLDLHFAILLIQIPHKQYRMLLLQIL